MITWDELLVTDDQGAAGETLGSMIRSAPGNLDSAIIDHTGKITEWPNFFISAEGEEASSDSPCAPVDWSGLREKLGR